MKWFLLLLPAAALAQPVSFGVKVGAPVMDAIHTDPSKILAENKRFIIGPTFEVRLPFGFGIEADALYRRYEYTTLLGSLNPLSLKSGAWEFPVLAKVRGSLPLVKPYAVGGLVFHRLTTDSTQLLHKTNFGVAVGGGLQINVLLLKISPEIRYTRWTLTSFQNFNLNQADILVGFTF